jgi:hypothetical protein
MMPTSAVNPVLPETNSPSGAGTALLVLGAVVLVVLLAWVAHRLGARRERRE